VCAYVDFNHTSTPTNKDAVDCPVLTVHVGCLTIIIGKHSSNMLRMNCMCLLVKSIKGVIDFYSTNNNMNN
jgi:hypothetical protein